MIRHVVSLQLAATEPAERRERANELRDQLRGLRDVSPGLVTLDVYFDLGDAPAHWPVILVADFVDAAALNDYQSHPRHRDVVTWMNAGVVSDRVVVDFALT